MRKIMTWMFVLLIPISASAQNDECLQKGQVITVLIPSGADVRDGASFAGTRIYATDLDAVAADGWGNRLPRVVSLPFEKIGDKGGFEELELRGNLWFKVRFTSRALFEQYAVCGPADGIAAEDRLEEIFAAVGEATFANVQEVTPDLRTELARYAYGMGAESLPPAALFRDKNYMVLDLGSWGSTYNTVRLNQAQRTALVLTDLLDRVKTAGTLTDAGLAGVRLDLTVRSRNFAADRRVAGVTFNSPSEYDQMSWYVDSVNIPALLDFEITSQEFVNRSVVIVNDNRVEVNLSDQG